MKAPIRKLDSLTHNDTAATKLINDNFEALQQGIEDSLSRTGKTPNFMDAVLDMNMNRIINIADPVDDYDLANKHYVDEQVAIERNRAIAAEGVLSDAIAAERARAVLAEQGLAQDISAEETRAKAAEKAITDTLDTYGNIVTHDTDEFATAAQGAKADSALQPGDLGDGTITLTQGGVTKGTFTTNQSGNATIELDAGSGDVGNGTITISQGGVVKGSFTVNQDSDTSINLDAVVSSDNMIEIYPVTVSILEGSTTTSVDVTSSVDLSKKYFPIAVFQEVSTPNVLNYCSYVSGIGSASVHFFSNGLIVGDLGVALYLIPVESSLVNVRGLTNGIGKVTTALSGKQDTISDLSTIRSGAEQGATAVQPAELSSYQLVSNLVTSVSGSSTDSQYPSAKLFYDTCGDIETVINAL